MIFKTFKKNLTRVQCPCIIVFAIVQDRERLCETVRDRIYNRRFYTIAIRPIRFIRSPYDQCGSSTNYTWSSAIFILSQLKVRKCEKSSHQNESILSLLAIRVNCTYNRTNRGLIRVTLGPFECIPESRV